MAPFIVDLPLPPRVLSPNGSRGHWSQTARGRNEYRAQVGLIVLSAVRQQRWSAPARASLELEFGTLRRVPGVRDDRYYPIDPDNAIAAFKPGLDGLVDAGALAGDDTTAISELRVSVVRSAGPWVRVTVREEQAS